MRLYLPTTALRLPKQKFSLVVYYHGGGFITGSVDFKLYDDFCNLMARELNVVVASPSYRLAPEHRLPAAYHDGADALTFIRKSDDEWIKSHVYLFNVFLRGTGSGGNLAYSVGHRVTNVLDPLRICGLIRHVNDQVFPPAVGDLCWELCLPVGENRDHAYSNPTMGDGLEILGALKWKVMVCEGGGDPMIDRHRNVAKLMKEKGLKVVECFSDGDVHGAELGDPSKSETLFASIKSFISSTPYRF
uniref:Alpha/beta hydrolase fold-3 domain-containing protein n=2 Tax=Brassica oleracea var. oleracea TaxID=109376 RepID=A0A0D3AYB4_BRAOL